MSTPPQATEPAPLDGFVGPRGHVEAWPWPGGGIRLEAADGGPVVVDTALLARLCELARATPDVPVGPR